MDKRMSEQTLAEMVQNLNLEPLKLSIGNLNITSGPEFPDLELNLSWQTKTFKFIAEIKQPATPQNIQSAIWQLQRYLTSPTGNDPYFPLIIAPYLSETTLATLTAREISGIDLSGNAAIIVPGQLFFYKTGARNKFPSNAPIKNVYSGASSLAARVFLSRPEYPSVGEVVEEVKARGGNITFPTVSKVLKVLEADLIVGRREGIRLLDGSRLLEKLKENYKPPITTNRIQGKVQNITAALEEIRNISKNSDIPYSINEPGRYATMPGAGGPLRIYTRLLNPLADSIKLEETNRFPNIELVETADPAAYFDSRNYENLDWVSPLQTFLELAAQGKREQETALEIRNRLLNFKY
jgi:hypothetical protein